MLMAPTMRLFIYDSKKSGSGQYKEALGTPFCFFLNDLAPDAPNVWPLFSQMLMAFTPLVLMCASLLGEETGLQGAGTLDSF